ncbi:MGDG synthase family glycosyltransferase [Methylacidiphilum caldifontis]|uniref:UDP-N-acetylglucosamine--LPS N-acetylglucosamine transferase n=1 Tax=Methylacidiphilum caldifontis TaxID=2795386 RepID=A0A4Y8PHH9_9BACT|nr:PHP domain-containing protein [Methylacidiphilum caldifontis]QSR88529.1 UDP-N-acetylglucosamine--LPS N-acetylglucosamine transferase [Methylacidiphilum caldifontis]TFE72079.1 UDP-N-acetylglucosamine--LPS N-acetylglucosamine transferase [Methylacidiphilum caldifontis]
MKRILILTAGFGEGHNTAARNIQEAIEHLEPDKALVDRIDLFDSCYGKFSDLLRQGYLTAINRAPIIWRGIYSIFDRTTFIEDVLVAFAKMKQALDWLLREMQPDVVLSTYPFYNFLIDEIFKDGKEKNFVQITVITDSITVNSFWYRSWSDYYIVPNADTAAILKSVGIAEHRILEYGFPVQLEFLESTQNGLSLEEINRPKILYIINSGRKKAAKIIEQLLLRKHWQSTIVVGKDQKLFYTVADQVKGFEERVEVLGWTNKIPELLLNHHVVISKAGGATVQEAIAACCPMIIPQVVPGQEEGNYELLRRYEVACFAEKPADIGLALEYLFENEAQKWKQLKNNLRKISKPDSSLKIARFVLDQSLLETVPSRVFHFPAGKLTDINFSVLKSQGSQALLCDFHIHSTYSDGRLSISEIVDFYGQRGFDCICVTDHLVDRKRLIGKFCELTGLVLTPTKVGEYFDTIEKEKKRAWKKYGMILFCGIEFNKDGYSPKTSAHLLGIDLKSPIDPCLSLKEIIAEIHKQNALAVASHPHVFQSVWGPNTLFLWENQQEYAPLLDAWEVANRYDLFSPVGLKKLPFIANSDFHKPKHIYSWKTILHCPKDPEEIKECIRSNRNVAITLYRDHKFGAIFQKNVSELEIA